MVGSCFVLFFRKLPVFSLYFPLSLTLVMLWGGLWQSFLLLLLKVQARGEEYLRRGELPAFLPRPPQPDKIERDSPGWGRLEKRGPGRAPGKGMLQRAPGTLRPRPRPDQRPTSRGWHRSSSKAKAERPRGQGQGLQRSQHRCLKTEEAPVPRNVPEPHRTLGP